MLPKLQKSNIVKKEIYTFKKIINSIDNQNIKLKANNLLSELEKHFNIINEAHNPLTNNSIDPRKIRENVKQVSIIRNEIKKIIKDFKLR